MIISKTPLRVSLLGGSTDVKDFYTKQTSHIFGGSIDKYVYVISNQLSKFSNEKFRFTYRITESVTEAKNFNHPVVREVLKIYKEIKYINISTMADLPGSTGLGSSSAFTVALIQNLTIMQQKHYSPLQIAKLAIKVEREIIKEPGGIQDQLHSSIGGLRYYKIKENKIDYGSDFSETNFGKKLNNSLVLVRVGDFRPSKSAHFLRNKMSKVQLDYLSELNKISFNFKNKLKPKSNSLNLLIDSVNESWDIKKKIDSNSTNKEIENLCKLGFDNGVLAAKLCGAGKSGFVLFICDPLSRPNLVKILGHEKCELFEFTKNGSESICI
jgi:D-glycero-alpha-D-manno-heptose-7-phosphate kinase